MIYKLVRDLLLGQISKDDQDKLESMLEDGHAIKEALIQAKLTILEDSTPNSLAIVFIQGQEKVYSTGDFHFVKKSSEDFLSEDHQIASWEFTLGDRYFSIAKISNDSYAITTQETSERRHLLLIDEQGNKKEYDLRGLEEPIVVKSGFYQGFLLEKTFYLTLH